MGRVIHFEIHAQDPERAVEFYEKVFGWEMKRMEGPMEYWLVQTGPQGTPGIDGGIMRRRGQAPTEGQAVNSFVVTVGVKNVDKAVDKALEAGGRLALKKMAIPGVGWQAYVKDTEGNLLGLHEEDSKAE